MRIVMLIWLMLFGTAAMAAPSCPVPPNLPVPDAATPRANEAPRNLPIGGYTLATVWMPQHCRRAVAGIAEVECRSPAVRSAGLTLHGLWPDGKGRDWPQWCSPAQILKPATIAAHYCATPSARLMQHEWAKHGTCMPGFTPERYFDKAEGLYRDIRIPDLKRLSYRPLTASTLKRAISRANPGVTPAMFKLRLDRRGWLEEIWFCLDTRFAPKICEGGDARDRPNAKVLIWRGGRGR